MIRIHLKEPEHTFNKIMEKIFQLKKGYAYQDVRNLQNIE